MPMINVTPLLFDSYIAGEKFTVYRRTEAVNSYGESIVAGQVYPSVIGQVSPIGPNNLLREPSFTSTEKSIYVITNFPLTKGSLDNNGNTYQPDLVQWKNSFYIVCRTEDYSKYGAGFVAAVCEVFDWEVRITDIPPQVENFLITSDGQFVITSSGEMVTYTSETFDIIGNVNIKLGLIPQQTIVNIIGNININLSCDGSFWFRNVIDSDVD